MAKMIPQIYRDSIKVILIILLLTILNYSLPLLSFFIYIIWPIPVVYFTLKYGMKKAFFLIILVAVINGLMLGAVMGLYTVIGFGLIGFLMGTGLEEGFSPLKILLLTILAVLISNLIIAGTTSYIFGFSYDELFNNIIESIGQNPEYSNLTVVLRQQLDLVRNLFPAITVITSIISGALTYYIALWYLKKKGIEKEVFKQIKDWYFPHWWVSSGIVISLLFKSNIYFLNLNVVLLFLASLQGFATGLYFISRRQYPPIFTFIYVMVIVLFNIFSLIVLALVGLIDMWFNLRKVQRLG